MTISPFSQRVRQAFSRGVSAYEPLAPLQRSIAWRLAGLAHHHGWSGAAGSSRPLPPGPGADLGAGTGLLSRALAAWRLPLPEPLLQLDLCPEALARNPAGPPLAWDLNQGLPASLRGAALLGSSFALQWLDEPAAALAQWAAQLAPGGWLLLAAPTAGSFPEWRRAAQLAGVPCGALPLPRAAALLNAAAGAGLELVCVRTLTFSGATARTCSASEGPDGGGQRGRPPALRALRSLRAIGADASRQAPLSPGAWRRLLAAWPAGRQLSWEVLLLLARRPGGAFDPGGAPCGW
jgi:malonyl-CoA O-methyltransferase